MDSISSQSRSKLSFSEDDSMSGSRTSSSSKSFWTRKQQNDFIPMDVAVKEQKRVVASKVGMILTLIIVAVSFCVTTYFFLKAEEEKFFEQQFESHASEVIAVSIENVESTFDAIELFAESMTISASDANEQWPNVTLSHFASKSTSISALAAGAGSVTMGIVVEDSERAGFEDFARNNVRDLMQETIDYQRLPTNATELFVPERISERDLLSGNITTIKDGSGPYVVNWQQYPFPFEARYRAMIDLLGFPLTAPAIHVANATLGPKLTFIQGIRGLESQVVQPIFGDILNPEQDPSNRKMVGIVRFSINWTSFFSNLLPEGDNGTFVVLKSSCGINMTFSIDGLTSQLLGMGDLHDTTYDEMEIAVNFFDQGQGDEFGTDLCIDKLTLHLYPSKTMEDANKTNKPFTYASIVGAIFIFTSCAFMMYDCAVQSRQRKVVDRVITQDKIVSNLFPASIRDQLYGLGNPAGGDDSSLGSAKGSKLDDVTGLNPIYGSKPIANLYLETTVLFADISGFTAWSSAREPSQVFTLLEAIYGAFDRQARRHQVFKVETIGDCYVAVAGLPEPNEKHAPAMAKFARDCVEKMKILTAKLEIGLGPGTADLELRVGLHSGQVTAGVLRGERSRFQLFGDTVNVASRMESSGMAGKIHISSFTADLLKNQGRSKWVIPRGEVMIPGKGPMQTFWLETQAESDKRIHALQRAEATTGSSNGGTDDLTDGTENPDHHELWSVREDDDDGLLRKPEMSKKERLIEWHVELLCGLLKRILAARQKAPKSLNKIENKLVRGETVLEEFQEIITLPKVTMTDLKSRADPDYVVLDKEVIEQLRSLITRIANCYRDNAFHSFEHASHVTASVAKLLSRIVTSDTTNQTHGPDDLAGSDLAGHSYGITSDPLTQFTVVFSAIIHDADHPGVPNAQLIKEHVPIAEKYKGKSVAEQNSVDLVWSMLLEPQYKSLRACIYADEVELKRFRQVLVNVVMATDIVDKELGALRKARWNKAFDPENSDSADVAMNRKATIVLEHLIQASDVSHTMQHWQVYRNWNQKFFMECYGAYKAGRADKDPSEGWYKGEIGFFDFYIIPLAKKLDSCGVFGVSSHEYLNYAMANRNEWEKKGEDLVKEYIKAFE